jgi:hypothetical protein
MPLARARRTDLSRNAGRPDGVIYHRQYVRCGKPNCQCCPPTGPGHGPYWYGFYWDYRQRTRSFYVGKHLPTGVEELADHPAPDARAAAGERPPSEPADTRT